jgi:glycosyltransferase involved in cell wall biosynthesis
MSETGLKVSVIVPAKDAQVILPDCLQALLNQADWVYGRDYEVIVVDDGSTDQTAVIAQQTGVRCVSQPNAGPASARNHGARVASGQILAFTDADCIPAAGWLNYLSAAFKDKETIGAKGIYLTRETGWMPRFVQAEYAYKYERMQKLERIDFVDTYSAAYRREIFLAEGGFNEVFPVPSVEDQEFSFRLARKGYKMVFCPQAAVYHRHDLNLGEYIRRKYGIAYWKAFMLRWLPEKTFSDSHTPPEQRWQIAILALALLFLAAGVMFPLAWWAAAGFMVLFYLSARPFLGFLRKYDRSLILPSLWLLLVRAGIMGTGLAIGLFWPGKKRR